MPIDFNRASFVQRSHRYETVEDLSIRATYPSARELTLDTNLTAPDANAIATALFNDNSRPALAYRVVVEGTIPLDSIEGGTLRWTLDSSEYSTDGRVLKTAEFEVDYENNRTTMKVRG